MTVTPARETRQPKPTEPSTPSGPFDAASAAYHRRVGDALSRYQSRCADLQTEYATAVEAAYKEPTPALIQQRLNAANETVSKGLLDAAKSTNDEVVQSLRTYITTLKTVWAEVNVDEMTTARLARAGQDLWFIAHAASGAFPAAWWAGAGESAS
jgi:hypothetical protein